MAGAAPFTEAAPFIEAARAKVNLFLHVVGRRDDGYHLLDSLACFPASATPCAPPRRTRLG